MKLHRRTFLQGCCAGIVAMNGSRLGNLVFAQGAPAASRDVVINVFLRGGMDALNFLIPVADSLYHDARPRLRIQGSAAAGTMLDGYFALHPSAAPLKELYDEQHLALIPATGLPDADGSRSHFQAQDYMDNGGKDRDAGGWIGRYLNGAPSQDSYGGVFRGLTFGASASLALSGFPGALAMNDPGQFTLRGSGSHAGDIRRALRLMYNFDASLGPVAIKTLDTADLLDANPVGAYAPTPGVVYGDNDFSRALANIAQLVKMDLGLQAATVDMGGWDTHESQADGNSAAGAFARLVEELAGGLHSFWNDMASHHGRLTVVVMSEFGRRLKENDNRGTDHGHGGAMMVLNRNIAAKQVWGAWPGLANDSLFERKDLAVTTDFRTVLGEIFTKRLGVGSAALANYFPGFVYPGPLGFLETPASATASGVSLY